MIRCTHIYIKTKKIMKINDYTVIINKDRCKVLIYFEEIIQTGI